jgi:PAS domain S-box-containing protein
MSEADDLRQRRQELWRELTRIDAELAGEHTVAAGLESWLSRTNAAPQIFTLLDARSRILFVNHLPPGRPDPVGRSVLEFVPDDRRDELRDAIGRALDSGLPQYFEGEGQGPVGESSWYSTWVVPMTGPSRTTIAVVSADITQARRVEEALASEKSLFESLVAHAPDTVMVVGRDYRVQFINRTRAPRTVDDVMGKPADTLVADEYQHLVREAMASVFATGQPTEYETRVQLGDATRWYSVRVGPVLEGGEVTRVSLVATDITRQREQARLQAEQQAALQQSEERFRTLVEFAPEAMVIFDVDTGLFVDVNANACELFGMSREDLLRCGPQDVSPPEQPDGTPSAAAAGDWVQRTLEGEHPVFEWYHRDSAEHDIPCEVRLVRLPHHGRRWVRGSIIDITQRKQADEERARLTTELAQAQKLQAIGQLTGGVAHDFNNLLTVIMSSLEMIELEPDDVDRVLAHTRQALGASERAAALTQQLLAFARRQPLRPRVVNLNDLVRDAESLLRRALGERVIIDTVAEPDLWPCESDPAQLENAILNLAINARDAMPDGGHLAIETANVRVSPADTALQPDMVPGDYVMLRVTDDGVGMAPEVVRHAFEPFFTTKDAGQGSGLGLSMVYGFVRQSGGHVQIESRPGDGTAVCIHLPRCSGDAAEISRQDPPATTPRGRGERVLVVEDDPSVRSLVVQSLQGLGYQVLQAVDAGSALTTLDTEDSAEVRVVLTDVVLPGGRNGPALARELAIRQPALPVLYMSGYSTDALSGDGRLDSNHTLLEKPFTRQQLAMAVRTAIDEASP